jgi:hypothetical protein
MNQKIKLHETMEENVHFQIEYHGDNVTSHKPRSKKAITASSMFLATVDPVSGLSKEEIDILVEFISNAKWVLYYAIEIEVIKRPEPEIDTMQMNVSLVTSVATNVLGIKDRFQALINENESVQFLTTRARTAGDTENLKIVSCRSKLFATRTPMIHCAIVLKSAAAGKTCESITENDYNNRLTHWTNLFDGEKECTDENELQQWKMNRITFAHLLMSEQKKKNNKAPLMIASKDAVKMARSYASLTGVNWTEDTHFDIVATMVTDKGRESSYELAPSFLAKVIKDSLNENDQESEDYKELLIDALKLNKQYNDDKLAKLKAKLTKTTAPSKQEAKLAAVNQKLLVKIAKLETQCQKHVFTIENLKRKARGQSPLLDPTKTSSIKFFNQHYASNAIPFENCVVCSGTNSESNRNCMFKISPCNHVYCRGCIEEQFDNNITECSHCTFDALQNGAQFKSRCLFWKRQYQSEIGQGYINPHYKKRKLDTGNDVVPEQERKRIKK